MKSYCFLVLFTSLLWFSAPAMGSKKGNDAPLTLNLEQEVQLTEPARQWVFLPSGILAVGETHFFRTADGKVQSTPLPENYLNLITSPSGNYYALLILHPLQESRDKQLEISVNSAEGKEIYRLELPQPFDEPYPVIALSDADGRLAVGFPTLARIQLFGSDGRMVREVSLFENAQHDLERQILMEWSRDGSRLVVAATRRGVPPPENSDLLTTNPPELFLFDATGNLIWRESLPGASLWSLEISPDAGQVAVASYRVDADHRVHPHLTIWSGDGNLQHELNLRAKTVRYSPDGRRLLAISQREVAVIDTRQGKALWTIRVAKRPAFIAGSTVSADGHLLAVLTGISVFQENQFVYRQPEVYLLSDSGKIVQKIDVKAEEFLHPAIKFSDDGQKLFIGLKQSLKIFKVK